jgi:cytochrome b subunit of formate dehydrogenase
MSSLDAGIMGIGILFLILALIDILRGEFKHNEKLIWIIVIILGIIIGIGGVVIKSLYQIEYETKSSLELLFGLIQLILFALYAIIGRKRKLT